MANIFEFQSNFLLAPSIGRRTDMVRGRNLYYKINDSSTWTYGGAQQPTSAGAFEEWYFNTVTNDNVVNISLTSKITVDEITEKLEWQVYQYETSPYYEYTVPDHNGSQLFPTIDLEEINISATSINNLDSNYIYYIANTDGEVIKTISQKDAIDNLSPNTNYILVICQHSYSAILYNAYSIKTLEAPKTNIYVNVNGVYVSGVAYVNTGNKYVPAKDIKINNGGSC